jgi:rhodanese-related sulfurtransferase
VNSSSFDKEAAKLDRSKTYLIHCAAGVRSMKACNSMRGMQFTNLYNLRGGYKAWVADGNKGVK